MGISPVVTGTQGIELGINQMKSVWKEGACHSFRSSFHVWWRVRAWSQDTTDVIYAEDEEVFRETAVRELLKLGFLRPWGMRWVTVTHLAPTRLEMTWTLFKVWTVTQMLCLFCIVVAENPDAQETLHEASTIWQHPAFARYPGSCLKDAFEIVLILSYCSLDT